MADVKEYTVGRLAAISGVSVRTLHHYDEIGLLSPQARTPGGYRLYTSDDLRRLHQILFYRELDFGLTDIAAILAESPDSATGHLRRQHRLLRERIARQQSLLAALEKEMEAQAMGISLTPEEQFEIFGPEHRTEDYRVESEQRWGQTPAYAQSQRRTAAYTAQDWIQIRAETDVTNRAFVAAMSAGSAPDSPAAMDLAETHRQSISRWYYECGYDVHRGLAQMYVADARLAKNYDDLAPGLAQFVHDAIMANAERRGG